MLNECAIVFATRVSDCREKRQNFKSFSKRSFNKIKLLYRLRMDTGNRWETVHTALRTPTDEIKQ